MALGFGYNRASIKGMIDPMRRLMETFRDKEGGELCLPCLLGAIAVVIIALVAIVMIIGGGSSRRTQEADEPLTQETIDAIVQHGQILLTERINAGNDISAGPCLDNNEAFPGWVIDIAHDPREPVDDDPDNQCSAYRLGDAEHFVELSVTGDIIRISAEAEAE